MPAENPPSYDTAIHESPKAARANLERSRTNDSDSSDSSDGLGPSLIDEDDRKSMDDEQRDLPPGWVRCFDPKTRHHFYVEEATRRSIWIHPYDDPEFLNSLPDTHPANPNSKQGKAIRKRTEDELEEARRYQEERDRRRGGAPGTATANGTEHRNWFQKKKDKLIGTKEEREKAKEEKRRQQEEQRRRLMQAQQEYVRRRKELIEQQLNDPSIHRYYASNPYGYAPPSMAFSRAGGLYGSPYGYGYGGGYGRRYGYGGMGMGMGMGMPLMAGMGGGLLLGSVLGGGFGGYDGGYGDCGGGDMGGGDMGGGDM